MSSTMTDRTIVRGVVAQRTDERLVLCLPQTDYRLHLDVRGPVPAEPGKPLAGRIHARARRVDVIRAGGRYIEPVYGRPRRLQGRIEATDPDSNTLAVHCGCPFVCVLTASQDASDFQVGQLVSFDVERGAWIEPV